MLATIYWAGGCEARESAGSGCREDTWGVIPSAASGPRKIVCSSSYPQAGQTNPSQQKYGTISPQAGHCVVAIHPPPAH
jgi:hypothetical protein